MMYVCMYVCMWVRDEGDDDDESRETRAEGVLEKRRADG